MTVTVTVLTVIFLYMNRTLCQQEFLIGGLFAKQDRHHKHSEFRHCCYDEYRKIMDMAIDDLNEKLVPEFNIKLRTVLEDSGCDKQTAVGGTSNLLKKNVKAIIGVFCSDGCLSSGLLAGYANVPMISHGCSSSLLSDKTSYQTFARTRPYAREILPLLSKMIHTVLKTFKWKHVGIVHSSQSIWENAFMTVSKFLRNENITLDPIILIGTTGNKSDLMRKMKENSRIIIFFCYETDLFELLVWAKKLGMYNGEYAFITIDFLHLVHVHFEKYNDMADVLGHTYMMNSTNGLLTGLLDINVKDAKLLAEPKVWESFKTRVDNTFSTEVYDRYTYAYDAVMLYGQALRTVLLDEYKSILNAYLEETGIDKFLEFNNITWRQLGDINNGKVNITSPLEFPQNWTIPVNKSIPHIDWKIVNSTFDKSKRGVISGGLKLSHEIFNSTLAEGKSGPLIIDQNGDRLPIMIARNFVVDENDVKIVLEYDTVSQKNHTVTALDQLIWPGGGNWIPKDTPECGYDGMKCQKKKKLDAMLILVPFASVLFLIVGYKVYKKQKYENELMRKEGIISFDDLEFPPHIMRQLEETSRSREFGAPGKAGKSSQNIISRSNETVNDSADEENRNASKDWKKEEKFKTTPSGSPLSGSSRVTQETGMTLSQILQLGIKKRPSNISKWQKLKSVGWSNAATGSVSLVAKYQHRNVLVKVLPMQDLFLDREILVEMKLVRDLIHPNLNPYVGFCAERDPVSLVSLYCMKRSLMDVLLNEDIQLDWIFRHTFCMDISSGLQALHESKLQTHGRLTSKNVLVDNRWICKLADYGLFHLKDKQTHNPDEDEEERYKALLWTAPESILQESNRRTKCGDIYSFGIIMSEIINRVEPFASYKTYSAKNIVHFIHKRCIPPLRPLVRLSAGMDGRLLDLMRSCWDENPQERPTIGQVKNQLRTVMKGVHDANSLMDNIIEMMEKYAQGLENTIKERSEQLEHERDKVEKVIHRQLPKSVSEKVKAGEYWKPKRRANATILQFEVAKFSSFLDICEPHQIVDLIHDVYRIINIAIQNEDVFKVSTDRDQVAIVCGIPDKNEKHAIVMASIALKIMGSLATYRFRHVNDEKVKFKIALNSGSIVGAIVGLSIPVFNVIGATVDECQRMIGLTPPLRILVGAATHSLLVEPSLGFRMQPTQTFAASSVKSYYLLGRKGMDVKLPRLMQKNDATKLLEKQDSKMKLAENQDAKTEQSESQLNVNEPWRDRKESFWLR